KPLSSLWKVTRSTRPARTSWVDGSCCGFMSIVVSSASALGTPISWHIEVAGPDVCATLSGGVLVNDVVFRIPRSVERLAEDRRLPHGRIAACPFGAPLPSAPSCIRHLRRPVTGADLHGAPDGVLAPQRAGCVTENPASAGRMGLSVNHAPVEVPSPGRSLVG